MNRVKIFEMFLRDGLQSYKTIFNLKEKIHMFDLLNKCGYDCIEFGSTTSPKLIPQMEHSFDLWDHIKTDKTNNNMKYTMLVPSINHLDKCFSKNMDSYGLVTSVSNDFCERNMKTTRDKSLEITLESINKIVNFNKDSHIRVYISTSFGCPFSKNSKELNYQLENFINSLINIIETHKLSRERFDIVLSDTIGVCSVETLKEVLDIPEKRYMKYIGLHMHFRSSTINKKQKFERLIDIALDSGVMKYDCSLLGIGGCPYAKLKDSNDSIGNLSTIPFLEYLEKSGMKTGIDMNLIKETSREIEKFLIK
jgi:hydroxymethylglutaryl-CoA lyase